jgi:hypothetical protein
LQRIYRAANRQSGRSLGVLEPNFRTVTHPTVGMPQKSAGFQSRRRFVVLKTLPFPRAFRIDQLDTDVLPWVFTNRSSHGRTSKIKATPFIFARRTSKKPWSASAGVVPKSGRAPQCFDFESYFFFWCGSWVEQPVTTSIAEVD